MKSLKFLLCFGVAAVAAHAASSPIASWPKAYSVEMEMTAAGNKTATKMFVDGDKQRTDVSMAGMDMSTIVRKDKKVIWSLIHGQKMVTETPYQEPPAAAAAAVEAVWEKVGSANVNGVACTEYKVKAGGTETTWFVSGDNLPVRMVAAGNTTDWKNFKAGAPDAALFEVPAGYAKPGEATASSSDTSASGNADSGAAAPAEQPKKKKGLGGMLKR